MSALEDKYSIQDLLTHKVVNTHASNLSEFRHDPTMGLNPTEVAARNAGEFFVDKIVGHTGSVSRRSDMSFRVRWKGYTPDDDTWQPIKTVYETQAFVDYCRGKVIFSGFKAFQSVAWHCPMLHSSIQHEHPLSRAQAGHRNLM